MKRILSVLLAAVLCVGMLTGCGEKKEGKEESKKAESAEKEESDQKRLDNQAEITSNIAEVVTTQLPENMVRAGVSETPELQLKDAKADENIFTVSYNSTTGVELAFTYDLDKEKMKRLSLSVGEGELDEYAELLTGIVYLSEFKFSDDEIEQIASMVSNEITELEIGDYKIKQVSFPSPLFSIAPKTS